MFRNAIDFYILISCPATFLFTCYYLPITLFSSCLTALLRCIEYICISFMCKTLYFNFCIHYSACTAKNLVFTHQHAVDPFYPFCPPPPFPTGNNYFVLCIYVFVSVWFGLFIYLFIFGWFIFYNLHINEIIWYLSFSIWLISLSIIPSGSNHVVANSKILFLFMAEECYIIYVYTTSSLSIHLLMGIYTVFISWLL